MDAAAYLSLPCHESLHRLQHFVRLQYNQGIVSKPQKAPRCVSAVPFQAVHWGNGNPQRYALPWPGSSARLARACRARRPAGSPGRWQRWRLPGRPWLSLGVAGCQKIASCSQGEDSGPLSLHGTAEPSLAGCRRGAMCCRLSWWLWLLAKNEFSMGQEAWVWEEDGIELPLTTCNPYTNTLSTKA